MYIKQRKYHFIYHLDDEFGMNSNTSSSHHHHHHFHGIDASVDANLRHLEPRLLLGSDFHLAPSPTLQRRDVATASHPHQHQQQYLYLGGTGGRNLKPPMRNSMSRQSLMGKFRFKMMSLTPLKSNPPIQAFFCV